MIQTPDPTIVMEGGSVYVERRASNKPVIFKISYSSLILGFLLAAAVGLALGYAWPMVMAPKFSITMSAPAAHTGVVAGGVLPVLHGVGGECGPDGGMIHAEARPLGSNGPGEWRTVKEIKMLPYNLEPGKALSKWPIRPSYAPVGAWQGRITVWCNRAPEPWRSTFRFSLLGALRG